jgi:hypothetical protein
MNDMNLIVRTADKTRKADVTLSGTQTCGDVISGAIENWSLPRDTDYTIVNVNRTPPQTLSTETTLAGAGVHSGDTLEIQPVLVAGRECGR